MFGYNNKIVQNDLKELSSLLLPWEKLDGKCILVTGANGMLATYLIYTLLYVAENKNIKIKILALTRTLSKTQQLYKDFIDTDIFEILQQDICYPINYSKKIDYIFHFAGNASPYYIKNDPVGIMKSNLIGTFNVMELAKNTKCEKVLFASTREVYGETSFEILYEDTFGKINPLDNRSCYPESKRAAETILRSYFLQYGVDCIIARIAHCYGPGMKIDNDGRVMGDFIRNAVHNENISLISDGSAIRAFCYLTDAMQGLLLLLFYGKSGDAYNLANENEPLPIREVAHIISDLFPERNIHVSYKKSEDNSGYCNYKRVGLSLEKIRKLGYLPNVDLREGLKRTILSFE